MGWEVNGEVEPEVGGERRWDESNGRVVGESRLSTELIGTPAPRRASTIDRHSYWAARTRETSPMLSQTGNVRSKTFSLVLARLKALPRHDNRSVIVSQVIFSSWTRLSSDKARSLEKAFKTKLIRDRA